MSSKSTKTLYLLLLLPLFFMLLTSIVYSAAPTNAEFWHESFNYGTAGQKPEGWYESGGATIRYSTTSGLVEIRNSATPPYTGEVGLERTFRYESPTYAVFKINVTDILPVFNGSTTMDLVIEFLDSPGGSAMDSYEEVIHEGEDLITEFDVPGGYTGSEVILRIKFRLRPNTDPTSVILVDYISLYGDLRTDTIFVDVDSSETIPQLEIMNIATKIKGVNYYPSQNGWEQFWTDWEPELIREELALCSNFGFNTIRTFIPYDIFGEGEVKPELLAHMEEFLHISSELGMKVIFTLFDLDRSYPLISSTNTVEYSNFSSQIYSEGENEYVRKFKNLISLATLSEQQDHIDAVVGRFKDDNRVLAWGVINELDLHAMYWLSESEESDAYTWHDQISQYIKSVDSNHLVISGTARPESIEQMNMTNIDLYALHTGHLENSQEGLIMQTRRRMNATPTKKRPIIFEEFGVHFASSPPPTDTEVSSFFTRAFTREIFETHSAGGVVWVLTDVVDGVMLEDPDYPYHRRGLYHVDESTFARTLRTGVSVIEGAYVGTNFNNVQPVPVPSNPLVVLPTATDKEHNLLAVADQNYPSKWTATNLSMTDDATNILLSNLTTNFGYISRNSAFQMNLDQRPNLIIDVHDVNGAWFAWLIHEAHDSEPYHKVRLQMPTTVDGQFIYDLTHYLPLALRTGNQEFRIEIGVERITRSGISTSLTLQEVKTFNGFEPAADPGDWLDHFVGTAGIKPPFWTDFDAEIRYSSESSKAEIKLAGANPNHYGKVQTQNITKNIDVYDCLAMRITDVSPGVTMVIEALDVSTGIATRLSPSGFNDLGTFVFDVKGKTGWGGTKTFRVQIWIENASGGKKVELDFVKVFNDDGFIWDTSSGSGGGGEPGEDPPPGPEAPQIVWIDNFVGDPSDQPDGWIDESLDSEANAEIVYSHDFSDVAVTRTADDNWGKVLSPTRKVHVDTYPVVEFSISKLSANTTWKVGVLEYGTSNYQDIVPSSTETGDFSVDYKAITNWTGYKDVKVQLNVEGDEGTYVQTGYLRYSQYSPTATCTPSTTITTTPTVTQTSTMPPTITPTATPTPANAWIDHFESGTAEDQPVGWYDETQDSNHNANIKYLATDSYVAVSRTAENTWGKVLTAAIINDVDVFPMVQVTISSITPDTTWKVGIQENVSPWNYWNLNTSSSEVGTFAWDYKAVTAWSGMKNFSVVIVVEGGPNAHIELDLVRVTRPVATQTPTPTPTATYTPTPAPPNNAYWEDFDGTAGQQPAGWMDETQNAAFDAEISYLSSPASHVEVERADGTWGKVLSPLITCNVEDYSYVEIEMTTVDSGASWKLGIQEEGGSWQYWDLNTSQTGNGTFKYDYKTVTGWTGVRSFKVQITVEGETGLSVDPDWLRVGKFDTVMGSTVGGALVAYSPTSTATPTQTLTPTPTQVINTPTATPTQTATPTPTPWLVSKEVLSYPNPARGKVNFAYTISGQAKVKIDIYKLTGERVASITENVNGGTGQTLSTVWDAIDVAPGIYIARIVITNDAGHVILNLRKKVALIK